MNWYKYLLVVLLLSIIILGIQIMIILDLGTHIKYNPTINPKDYNYTIDSLKKENVDIVIDINKLDSIKDEEMDKATKVDNDSALRMFYKLLGKE